MRRHERVLHGPRRRADGAPRVVVAGEIVRAHTQLAVVLRVVANHEQRAVHHRYHSSRLDQHANNTTTARTVPALVTGMASGSGSTSIHLPTSSHGTKRGGRAVVAVVA